MEMEKDTMDAQSVVGVKVKEMVERFEEKEILNVDNFNVNNKSCRDFVVAISEFVAKEYVDLVEKLGDGHLQKFDDSLSKFSYRSRDNLFQNIKAWEAKRQQLIKIIDASADTLDNSYLLTKIGRLIGSSLDLLHNLDSCLGHKISGFVVEEAYGIHPIIGATSEALGKYVPHFAYLGLLSSFVDVLNTTYSLRSILKMVNEDIELFEKIEKWFQDTNELDENLKKLFPFGMDTDIARDIETILHDQNSYTKVFCTVFFSNVRHKFSLMKNKDFLSEAFLFSRKDVAKEWYNRALKANHPIEFEAEKLEFRAKLMALSSSASDSDTTVELGNQLVKLKNAPHLVQATINCISIYFAFQELMAGTKHKNSEFLRELSKRAKFCLEELQRIRRKLE